MLGTMQSTRNPVIIQSFKAARCLGQWNHHQVTLSFLRFKLRSFVNSLRFVIRRGRLSKRANFRKLLLARDLRSIISRRKIRAFKRVEKRCFALNDSRAL